MGKKEKKSSQHSTELRPEVRSRIETVVLEIFSKTDFHRATLREVAKKAGVSFSSIYQQYGSKEGLVFGCVDNWLSVLTDRLVDHLQGIEDLKEKTRKVFWVQLDFYERNPDVGRILFLTIPYRKWMADKTFKQNRMVNLFLDVLREGQKEGILNPTVPEKVLFDFLHGLVHRTFTMWIYRGQKEPMTARANELFEMLWRAISTQKQ